MQCVQPLTCVVFQPGLEDMKDVLRTVLRKLSEVQTILK